jgi:phage tail-like protein
MSAYYPPVGFHFKVDFMGVGSGDKDARFQEVTGLTAEMSVEELAVGGENRFAYKLPTRARYGNLILKRGMLNGAGLIKWVQNTIENFVFEPVDINVHLLNENHEFLNTWTILQGYPVKWVISDFKSMENSLVIETIEIAYQSFSRTK